MLLSYQMKNVRFFDCFVFESKIAVTSKITGSLHSRKLNWYDTAPTEVTVRRGKHSLILRTNTAATFSKESQQKLVFRDDAP